MTYGQDFFDIQEQIPLPTIERPVRQSIYEKAVELGCTLDGHGYHLLVMVNTAGIKLSQWIGETYPHVFENVCVTENAHRFYNDFLGWMKILYCYDPYWRTKN